MYYQSLHDNLRMISGFLFCNVEGGSRPVIVNIVPNCYFDAKTKVERLDLEEKYVENLLWLGKHVFPVLCTVLLLIIRRESTFTAQHPQSSLRQFYPRPLKRLEAMLKLKHERSHDWKPTSCEQSHAEEQFPELFSICNMIIGVRNRGTTLK